MLTTLLDIIGAALLTALAFFVWPPLALGVAGACALLASHQLSKRGGAK